MWSKDQTLVPLVDIVEVFKTNDFRWTILTLDGSGRFPNGSTWEDFQRQVDAGEAVFDWSEILEFARNLQQAYEGEIAATNSQGDVVADIEISDSTEYIISFDPLIFDRESIEKRAEKLSK